MEAPGNLQYRACWKWMELPGFSSGLHMVGDNNVVRPDVVLPLVKTDNSGQNEAGVDANTHIHLDTRSLSHVPGITQPNS